MSRFLKSFCLLGVCCLMGVTPLCGGSFPVASTQVASSVHPVIVLGGGIGALTSALYLSLGGLEPLVIVGKQPGGLLTQSHTVQNWPGELEIDGTALTDRVRQQAEASGAHFVNAEVVSVDFSKRPFLIKTRLLDARGQEQSLYAQAVIIAMGTEPNFLGVPGESGPAGYWGKGVTNCAICDGPLYRDQVVGVVGGGDSAVLEALYLSSLAKEVTVFVRKNKFKGVEEKRLQTLLAKPNVKVFYQTTVQGIQGDGEKLTHVLVKSKGKALVPVPLNGLFLAIGSRPNTALFQKAVELDGRGYISLHRDQQTSIEGVYAIGDIVDPIYKQAISAAGDGAKAALQAQQYLADQLPVRKTRAASAKTGPAIPSSEVIEIATVEQLHQELKSAEGPIVVDFYASWCTPCQRLAPLLESSAEHLSGKVKFLKVDVERCQALRESYNIQAMPTVLLFDPSGALIERQVGTESISDLLHRLMPDRSPDIGD